MLHVRLRPSCLSLCLLAFLLLPLAAHAQLVTAPGAGGPPIVRVIELNGTQRAFYAYYPEFRGGVRIALGDVTGDGVLDIITGAGPGGAPHVRVWNGVDLTEVVGFYAYDAAFGGGVFVAAADVDGDGRADIVTGAGAGGGPHVRVWSGADFHEIGGFFAYDPAFAGGVSVAAGDVDGDGRADVITGAGAGGGPHVRIWSGADFHEVGGFFAYYPAFPGGVNVAAGDINNDGRADIITGAGPGGWPHVRVWNATNFSEIGGFLAMDQSFDRGVQVAALDLTGDGRVEIVTGAGPGGLPISNIFDGANLALIGSYLAFDPSSPAGVFVASVGKNSGLRFTSANATSFTRGAASTFAVTTAGGTTPPALTVSGALPSGVTFVDNGDGSATLSGTPTVSGVFPLTFSADNGSTPAVTQSFTLTITEAPAITSAASTSFSIGSVGSTFTITTTGSPTPAITISGALPSGITFTDNNNGTATLAGTAAAGTAGTYPLVITASNNGGTATQNFTLTIQQGAAITSANTTTFTVGAAGSFTVTTAGSPTATTISVSGALPAGVTFVNNGTGTATLSGTPAAGTGGTYPLTITASNGVGSPTTQNFTLVVNQGPAITSAASATFTTGVAGTFTVTTSGSPTPTIAIGGAALPSGVTFVDNGNGTGTLSGTPAAGTGGTYAITFTATNPVGSTAPQAFTLTLNQAPAITSANTASFAVGTPGTFTVTTTGFPASSLALSGTLPSGVTFVDNGNGSGTLAGTPAAGTAGAYTLTFTASNGVLPNGTQTFTLNVNQAPAITSANNVTFTIGAASSFTVTTSGFPAPSIARGGAALPTGVTFVDNSNGTGTLSGTPAAGTAGPYALTFTATNVVGSSPIQNFTLTVACPVITLTPAPGALAEGTFNQAYSQTIDASGSTGITFAVTAGAVPPGTTLASNGQLTGTPTNTGTFNFTVTATDAFACTGSSAYSLLVRPNAVNEAFSGGVGNTQYVVAPSPTSSTPAVLAVGTVLSNDLGPGTLSATAGTFATTNLGSVNIGANGAFVYSPAVGFVGSSDTFSYTLVDGNGVTDTAVVTINLSGMIWYVNSSGANGDGRSHSPFNALNNAQAPSNNGDVIYVHTGGATTPGAIALKPSQTLWGAGGPFTLNGLTIPFTGLPTLSNTVTLANNVLVSTLRINSTSGPAIAASSLTGAEVLNLVAIVGGTSGIVVTDMGGTLNYNVDVSGLTTGPALQVTGGTGSMFGRLNITTSAGRAIDIQNKTAGTMTLAGAIVNTGAGVFLNNNTGATIDFTGGLSLSTGATAAFTATGGGTVSATQNNTTVVNTLTTTTGTALNVANTTIGAAALTFRSISASGAPNGILLNNTGAGGLTVTGNSAGLCGGQVTSSGATVTAPVSGDCTGGTIVSATGAGVSLTNAGPISLTRMRIANAADDGIAGNGVGALTLASTLIENNGNAVGDRGIDVTNLSGSGGLSSSTIRGSAEHNVIINNTAATLTSFNVTSSQFSTNSIVTGDDGILLLTDGAGNVTSSITQSAFTDNKGDHFQAATTASATGTINVTFSNNTLLTTPANDANVIGGGITISPSGSADLTFTISNNNIQQAFDDAINLNLGTASTAAGSMVGTISNNTIGNAAEADSGSESSNTVTVTSNGAGTTTVAVTNNVIRQYGNGHGILIDNKEGNSTVNATVTGNNIDNPGTFAINGIHVNAGATAGPPIDSGVTCAAITGNTATNAGLATADIRLRQRFNTTIRLPGYAGAASDSTAVNAFVSGNNGGAEVTSINNVGGGGFGFIGGAGCIVP